MKVKGTSVALTYAACVLADNYQLTVDQARSLKLGEPFELEQEKAEVLFDEGLATAVKE
jgi:hypothetical protein